MDNPGNRVGQWDRTPLGLSVYNCTIRQRVDTGKARRRVILTDSQDGRGGVWATYGTPGGIVEVHRSQRLQGEPRFTQRTEVVVVTPPHRFFQISQRPI